MIEGSFSKLFTWSVSCGLEIRKLNERNDLYYTGRFTETDRVEKVQLPSGLPDELLFSRLLRFFEIGGFERRDFIEKLLGSKRASIHPLLPNGIRRLSRFTAESSTKLLWEQTMAPLFSACLVGRADVIHKAMLVDKGDKVGRSCQLPCFKYHPKLKLKYCPECARENVRRFGVSYWHRSHHIFGVNVCSIHCMALLEIEPTGRSRISHRLLPPTDRESAPSTPENALFAEFACEKLMSLSKGEMLNPISYRRELGHRGYLTPVGRIRREVLSSELFDLLATLTAVDTQFRPNAKDDFSYISGLLDKHNTQHPAKHLLFSYWLSRKYKVPPPPVRWNTKPSRAPSAATEAKCLSFLARGISLTEITRRTGKSQCYLKRLAALNSIEIESKPTKLTFERKISLLQLARRGFHRNKIADLLSVSAGTVEMAISQEEGLVDHRKRCKYESCRRRYKVQIRRYLQKNPEALRKNIKKACSAAFFWLYLNERTWLEAALPAPVKTQAKPRVDWELRDQELAVRIRDVLSSCEGLVSRSQLDHLLGGHGWLLKHRARLPRTMNVYQAHVAYWEQQS